MDTMNNDNSLAFCESKYSIRIKKSAIHKNNGKTRMVEREKNFFQFIALIYETALSSIVNVFASASSVA